MEATNNESLEKAKIYYVSDVDPDLGSTLHADLEKDIPTEITENRITTFVTEHFPLIRRGDFVACQKGRYRNNGVGIWDGRFVDLDYSIDEYGNVPRSFADLGRKNVEYWSEVISHNNFVPLSFDAEERKEIVRTFRLLPPLYDDCYIFQFLGLSTVGKLRIFFGFLLYEGEEIEETEENVRKILGAEYSDEIVRFYHADSYEAYDKLSYPDCEGYLPPDVESWRNGLDILHVL